MRDLESTKAMLNEADQFITEHPDVLEMSTDDVFDLMDDDTEKMRSMRWGVMARVALKEFTGNDSELVDYLSGFSDGSLLCEIIGFILQQEQGIDFIELLLKANKKGKVDEIIPFIIELIKYGNSCHIERFDEVNESINGISDSVTKNRLIHSYAELIVNKDDEDYVYQKFLDTDTSDENLVQLILGMRRPLILKKAEKYVQWEDAFIQSINEGVKKAGIQYIQLSCKFVQDVDRHYSLLQQYEMNDALMKMLIPVYIEYLANESGFKRNDIVIHLIQYINDRRQIAIDALFDNLRLVDGPNEEIERIIEVLLQSSIQGFVDRLRIIDYPLVRIYENKPEQLFLLLSKAFESNHIHWKQPFWKDLHHSKAFLKSNSQIIIDYWLMLTQGNAYGFLFVLSCIEEIFDADLIYKTIVENGWPEQRVLSFLEGCCLFMAQDNEWIELLFKFSSCFENEEEYYEFCYENAYLNYPGKTTTIANHYLESDDPKKKGLAKRLIDKNNEMTERIRKGSEIKDFKPSYTRLQVYSRLRRENLNEINKKAEESSFLLDLFPSRKMKYGNKIAFVQKDNKNSFFKVVPFITNVFEMELPARELTNPLEMIKKRSKYIERRNTDETNS